MSPESELNEKELSSIERLLNTEWIELSILEEQLVKDGKRMAKELRNIRIELKKYLSLCDEETIIGGIRNLAQCYYSWKGIAEELDDVKDALNKISVPETNELNEPVSLWRRVELIGNLRE